MLDVTQTELAAQALRDFNRSGTHQRWSALIAHLNDFLNHSVELLLFGLEHTVGVVLTDDWAVGGDVHNIEFVNFPELTCLGHGGTGHTSELVVHAEVVLQGNGGEGLCSSLNLYTLFCLDGLVQTVAVATTFHDTSRLLIHNLHLSFLVDDVLVIAVEECVGFKQLSDCVDALGLH